jgi:hypothetical protein
VPDTCAHTLVDTKLTCVGWRGVVVHCSYAGLVHVICDHGCRNAMVGQLSCRRLEPLLEKD